MESKRSFITLDGLRGIAALAVITRHAPAYFSIGPFFESYLAVDFFFVLSGFVLAHAYGARFSEGLTPLQFVRIRLIRLYPLYFLALAISASVEWKWLAYAPTGLLDLSAAILLLPSPSSQSTASLFPLNAPAWSLFFELLANLCFALIGRRLGAINLFGIVVVAGLALAVAVAFRVFGFGAAGVGAMADGFQWQSFGAGCLRVAYSFSAGVLVYRIWRVRQPLIKVPYYVVALLLIAILVAHPPPYYQTAFDLVVTIVIFPTLVWLGAVSAATGPIARLFTWLGAASYAVYVLQEPLYRLTRGFFGATVGSPGGVDISSGVIFIALVFAIAIIADRYFDKPARAALTVRLGPAPASPRILPATEP